MPTLLVSIAYPFNNIKGHTGSGFFYQTFGAFPWFAGNSTISTSIHNDTNRLTITNGQFTHNLAHTGAGMWFYVLPSLCKFIKFHNQQ